MKQNLPRLLLVLAALCLLASALDHPAALPGAVVPGVAVAQQGDGYDLSWWTVDSGGGESSGDSYSLDGIIGQPDAGPALTGGDYILIGGFWPGAGAAPAEYSIYLPLVLRNFP